MHGSMLSRQSSLKEASLKGKIWSMKPQTVYLSSPFLPYSVRSHQSIEGLLVTHPNSVCFVSLQLETEGRANQVRHPNAKHSVMHQSCWTLHLPYMLLHPSFITLVIISLRDLSCSMEVLFFTRCLLIFWWFCVFSPYFQLSRRVWDIFCIVFCGFLFATLFLLFILILQVMCSCYFPWNLCPKV